MFLVSRMALNSSRRFYINSHLATCSTRNNFEFAGDNNTNASFFLLNISNVEIPKPLFKRH